MVNSQNPSGSTDTGELPARYLWSLRLLVWCALLLDVVRDWTMYVIYVAYMTQ